MQGAWGEHYGASCENSACGQAAEGGVSLPLFMLKEQAVRLVVPSYPFKKSGDGALTPNEVETASPHGLGAHISFFS